MNNFPKTPPELLHFPYPEELFTDITPPLQCPYRIQERYIRMAKYAVIERLEVPFTEEKKLKIARNETAEASFSAAIRKAWTYTHGNGNGLENGDIELAADELGVLEIVMPFNKEELQVAREEITLNTSSL